MDRSSLNKTGEDDEDQSLEEEVDPAPECLHVRRDEPTRRLKPRFTPVDYGQRTLRMVRGSVRWLLLLTVVIGCTAPPAREAVVLRIAVWGPLGEMAPIGHESALASIALPWVFEKLVTVDATGQLTPLLAGRIERLSSGQIRLELRQGATFSDGSPVTDGDIIRSLESGGISVTGSGGVFVVESRQLGVPPDPLLLQTQIFRESQGRYLGSGPFAVASQSETEIRLTRRVPRSGRVNDVRLVAYATPRDAFAHTLRGDANVIFDLESRWLEFFRGVPSLQIVRGAGRSTDAIIFNPDLPRRERLQLATLLASPRLRELTYGTGECAETSGTANAETTIPPGPPLRLLSWGIFERLALAARRTLADRGGEVVHATPKETISRMKNRDFDLVTARPTSWPPTMMALLWRTGSPNNLVGYSNREVDRAIDAGDWARAESALLEDPPAALVCTRNHLAVVDVRIKNPVLGPYELLETLPEWEVAQ